MPKQIPKIEMLSYGLYQNWEKNSKAMPDFIRFTTEIPCELDIEFGYVLNIKKAKGQKLTYSMIHPSFKDKSGNISPTFEGDMYINSNDWDFYLGDTIWEPVSDKNGTWQLITFLDGKVIADKSFELIAGLDQNL